MANTDANTRAAVALNRFGLGARPDEPVPPDPRRWLLDQLAAWQPRSEAWSGLATTESLLSEAQEERKGLRGADEMAKKAMQQVLRRGMRDGYLQAVQARAQSALATPAPFVERLSHFWANHFAVSVEKIAVTNLAGPLELEAIRPHVLGRFEDMLLAVERHPAMLLYLDQARSIGPNSPAASRANARANATGGAQRGLNENLAREIMELHTLGVRNGYTQDDVTEFARAMTGWSIGELQGSFAFRAMLHEPGVRNVMGRRYEATGEGQALAILRDLAASPATARHLATKLATHFVSDTPPPALVQRLTDVYLRTRGDLPSVYRALLDAPEAWVQAPQKFKTPWDWTLSSLRALGRRDVEGLQIAPLLTQLGQPVWRPGSPAGFDDIAASWAAPDALVRRVELAQRFAARAGNAVDPRTLAPLILPGTLSEATQVAISRSESSAAGLALLLVSPDFLRR